MIIDTSSISLPFPNVVYAYPEAGIYDITLTVSSFCGVTDTTTEITVYRMAQSVLELSDSGTNILD